jgi:Ca2+-binding EF-hand superfamily protein
MIRGMNPLSAGSYQSERYGGTLGYGVCYNIILMRDEAGRIGVEYALTDQQDSANAFVVTAIAPSQNQQPHAVMGGLATNDIIHAIDFQSLYGKSNGEVGMMFEGNPHTTVVLTVSRPPPDMAPPKSTTTITADVVFDSVDKDGSAGIDRKEFAAIAGNSGLGAAELQQKFQAIDKDGDGIINENEFRAAQAVQDGVNPAQQSRSIMLSAPQEQATSAQATSEQVEKIFTGADKDGSGGLDAREFAAMASNKDLSSAYLQEKFKMLDLDGDGIIDENEMQAAPEFQRPLMDYMSAPDWTIEHVQEYVQLMVKDPILAATVSAKVKQHGVDGATLFQLDEGHLMTLGFSTLGPRTYFKEDLELLKRVASSLVATRDLVAPGYIGSVWSMLTFGWATTSEGKTAADQKDEMVNGCNNIAVVSSLLWTIAWAMFFSIPFDCFCGGSKSAMPGACWCDGPFTTDPKYERVWSLVPLSVFHLCSTLSLMVFWWSTVIAVMELIAVNEMSDLKEVSDLNEVIQLCK